MTTTNLSRPRQVAETWFAALNDTNMPALRALFSPDGAGIRNAAQAPVRGADAPRRLLEDFFSRTASRHFSMIDCTVTAGEVMAAWHGILTFRAGVQIADVTLPAPLSIALRGVDRFVLDPAGYIVELAIDHETTTLVQAARAAVQRHQLAADVPAYEAVVRDYFRYEESGDVEGVVGLCDPAVVVRNAAQPAVAGLAGVRNYVESFRDRTTRRAFEIVSISVAPGLAYAAWKADLEFRAGVAFGPVTSMAPFSLPLEGICRFAFGPEGKLTEIDVFHETTSALRRAQETCDVQRGAGVA